MNRNILFTLTTLAALAYAPAALAQGQATPDYPQAQTSQLSRASVVDALHDARMAGLVVHGEIYPAADASEADGPTRAQVMAELRAARELGLIAQGERNPLPTAAQRERIRQAGLMALDGRLARRVN